MNRYETVKEKLSAKGQEGLLRFYDELDDEKKDILLSAAEGIDLSTPDILKNADLKQKRGEFKPLSAVKLSEIATNRDEYESIGFF